VSFINTAPVSVPFFGSGTAAASSRTTKTGWTVGGGVETSLAWMGWSPNWSAKLEYLYVDLGSVSNSVTAALGGGTGAGGATSPAPTSATLLSSHDIRDHIIRVGVNYRFGGWAPARY
jgi:outer membrane immunogenic protein